MQLAEGLHVADRFRLIRELGRGGMGSVWLAEHVALDVACAIKFIDQTGRDSEELRVRFEREAKAAAQLRSPNVVQILDYGVWQDSPYIAMEYLEGENLDQRLDRVWVMSPGETCFIATQVARALTKAHAAGIVHRDLKPENIFLSRDADEEVAK
ncbi:MAG TPA: serine/threonine-protein kinase, partial [Polyangiaceae bacterium]